MGNELGGRPDGDQMYEYKGFVFCNLLAEKAVIQFIPSD
jgi:hypothetical protein